MEDLLEMYEDEKEENKKLRWAMGELIAAIDSRWDSESTKKRANAVSPRMEEALEAARKVLG